MKDIDSFKEFDSLEKKEMAEERLLAETPPCARDALPEQTAPYFQALRRQGNVQGGALLIYKGLMNVAVIAAMIAVAVAHIVTMVLAESYSNAPLDFEGTMERMTDAMTQASGWGYLLAVAVGFVILLLWKKPRYIRQTILQKGSAMTAGSFFALVCLVFGCQLPAQLLSYCLDWISRLLGGSFGEMMEQNAVDTDALPMWLYVCLAAPVAEELLFRGLLLRSLEPYGKKFAIVVSSVLFGLFHGNPVQTPYAFLVGLLLGYVATEYHVVWAIVLHIMNNLLLGDLLPRLLSNLSYSLADALTWILLGGFFLAALLVLLRKWRLVAEKSGEEQTAPWQRKAFWRAPCVVILCIWCCLDIAVFFLLMFL